MNFNGLRRRLEPVLRRLMHLYWRFSRGLTVGVRGLVINEAGEVLLIKHSYVEGWHLPGGGVEAGETLLQSLARELAEEGNVAIAGTPTLHAIYYNDSASIRDHVAVFIVRHFAITGPFKPNREITGHGFFARNALPADTTAGTLRRLAEVLDGQPPAQRW